VLFRSIVKQVAVQFGPEVNATIVPDSLQFNNTLGYYETAGWLPTNVTVTNYSANNLTFNVYLNFTSINSAYTVDYEQNVTVPSDGSRLLQFNCPIYNFTNGMCKRIPEGFYNITVDLWFENSTDKWDRPFPYTNSTVRVYVSGDVDRSGKVDMGDLTDILKVFGSTFGQSKYVLNCDLDCNGRVDMNDVIIALNNFGQHDP
jgi:hypothetical protein